MQYWILFAVLPSLIHGARIQNLGTVSDSEVQKISEEIYAADVNRAVSNDVVLNLQRQISSSQINEGQDYASQRLFSYVNEEKLFSKPTFARLRDMLNNYDRMAGIAEFVTSDEDQEINAFLDEIFKTQVIDKLYHFFLSKGYYSSQAEFKNDLKQMWFGLYSRAKGALDSSGFEHVFHGEIKGGKISGFHNWVHLYMLEKQGQVNYLSYSFDGPWSSFPDILAFQYKWSNYLKTLGSFFVGSSPEFDIAIYTLCFKTRPDKLCKIRLDGKAAQIQTWAWTKSFYGDGGKYIASSYPNSP
uniref:Protein endoU n=1 Tax=Geotrypetes seraphini TaxID=260995 RepID=A0A6P8R139_GEOSA|nr:poly(U)-specific endoribonuclease-D-like [Geotrypetes seraphini]XP_033792397.1 poly(U)-specific endoribonuclease-D-like [Geotrypetes seraphini]XP_033792398.1 poly(U)-specific endoribonuclease-D-like [Geotrypetes seraphini]